MDNDVKEERKGNKNHVLFTLFACIMTGIIVFLATNLGNKVAKVVDPETNNSTTQESDNLQSNSNNIDSNNTLSNTSNDTSNVVSSNPTNTTSNNVTSTSNNISSNKQSVKSDYSSYIGSYQNSSVNDNNLTEYDIGDVLDIKSCNGNEIVFDVRDNRTMVYMDIKVSLVNGVGNFEYTSRGEKGTITLSNNSITIIVKDSDGITKKATFKEI